MSAVLKALAWVAPQAAMNRARALQALDMDTHTRGYDGARGGRRGASFTARDTSANVEIGASLARLRDRSRDLVRNTSFGARIVDVHVANAIGTGINAVPDNGSDRIDKPLKQMFDDWAGEADVTGELCFGGLQALAWRSAIEGADSIIRRIPLREGARARIPLKLQVLEGDFIDHSRDLGMFEGQNTRLGIALGPLDQRVGYWLHNEHPGDHTFRGAPYASQLVLRDDIVHFYKPLRAGQVRGVPILAPILMNARDLADVMDAIVIKQRVEASFSAFITRKDGFAPLIGNKNAEAKRIETLRPGTASYLNPGEEVTFGQPSSQGQYEPVWHTTLMAMSAGAGLTYDSVTGDFSRANYSSLKTGRIIERRLTLQTQNHILVPRFKRVVGGWFVDAAIMAGELKPRKGGYRWDYILPANEPIDPRKDLEADILAVRAGRMTPQEFIGAWGQDWRKVVEDFEAFFAMVDKLPSGIVLDIDPRKVSQVGIAQGDGKSGPAPSEN